MNRIINISQDNKSAMRNPWVLGWLGLLITVLAVNVIFIVTAFKTSPGLVDKNYYEKGRDHDANYQKKLEARGRLGWHMQLQIPEHVTVWQPTSFTINAVDRIGNPLKDVTVTLYAYRPSDAAADKQFQMEPVAPGIYQSRIALPLKGIWDLRATVTQGEESLEVERRVIVREQ